MKPAPPATKTLILIPGSWQEHFGVVAQHQTEGGWRRGGAPYFDFLADERVMDARYAFNDCAFEDDGVLDLAFNNGAVVIDRREGADVAVANHGIAADDRRSANVRSFYHCAFLEYDATDEIARAVDRSAILIRDCFKHLPVALQDVLEAPRVLPIACH